MERLRLLTSKPAAKIIAWLQENPNTSLPWAPDTSKHANLMWKAGWLEREKIGKEVRWGLTRACADVILIVLSLEEQAKIFTK